MHNLIKKRKSIRSYKRRNLSKVDKLIVLKILKSAETKQGPFNHKVNFFFVENLDTNKQKIGTYGFIKNPPAFIGGVVENNLKGMVDFGFLFEEVILRLTEANLGTVWLGGTYKRSDFDVDVSDNEIIAAVSPVGYPAKKSIREKIIRKASKANKRKSFNELFFKEEKLQPIDVNHKYYQYLKAIQLGPSASNKQPWRIVLIDNAFHFFLRRTKGYGNKLKIDIQAIDIGIALSHLCLTLKEDNLSFKFINNKPLNLENCEYILSVQINKA